MSTIESSDFQTRHQVSQTKPKCCASMWKCNWQNGFIVTLEGGTAAAGVVALFHSIPLAGCLFVLSGSLCIVQGCWARDRQIADMSRVADKLEEDDVELGKTVNLVQQVATQVDLGTKNIQIDTAALSTVDHELLNRTRDIDAQNQKLSETNRSMENTIQQLGTKVGTLQLQAGQMKDLIVALSSHFREISEQNEKLKDNITDLSKQIDRTGGLEGRISGAIQRLDQELQPEARDLAVHIAAVQKSTGEIFVGLDRRNEELSSEMEHLKASLAGFQKTEQLLSERTKRVEELETQTREQQIRSEKILRDYINVTQELEKLKKESTEQTRTFTSVEHNLEEDLHGFNSVGHDFVQLADRFQSDRQKWMGLVEEIEKNTTALEQIINNEENES